MMSVSGKFKYIGPQDDNTPSATLTNACAFVLIEGACRENRRKRYSQVIFENWDAWCDYY